MPVKKTQIETYTGRFVDILEPDAGTISIEDIAHGLANQCRYGGQCRRFYSVASHSILVSKLVESEFGHDPSYKDIVLAALLHDSSEAYLVDIPTPVKRHLKDYKAIEYGLMTAIFSKFALPYEFDAMPDVIHYADVLALKLEAELLMKSKGRNYTAFEDFDEDDMTLCCSPVVHMDSPKQAKRMFMARYHELTDNTAKWFGYHLLYALGCLLPI